MVNTENTHLLRKGKKYHCTADLLFECFGFGRTSKSVNLLLIKHKQNSETSACEVSECSLLNIITHGQFFGDLFLIWRSSLCYPDYFGNI